MAVPSRKKSSTRTRKGRSVKNLKLKRDIINKARVFCVNCNSTKLLHYACLNCLPKPFKKKQPPLENKNVDE